MATPPNRGVFDQSLEPFQPVLHACAKKLRAPTIHVKPLGRYGYSGARLFLARFGQAGSGVPWVIKIDLRDNVSDEVVALTKAKSYFYDAQFDHIRVGGTSPYSGIMYQLHTPDHDNFEVTELREVYQKPASLASDQQLYNILSRLYGQGCRRAHEGGVKRKVWLSSQYKWYLRPSRVDRLGAVFDQKASTIEVFGIRYPHPATVLRELMGTRLETILGFVHGDLHPNNVVLAEGDRPALIDFAWAHEKADIYKDFVLMESSLRFLLFPSNIDWGQHRWINNALLSEDGPQKVLELVAARPIPHSDRYRRMSSAVAEIRSAAREAAGNNFDFNRYLISQFFVLYGLSKIEDYPFFQTADALGQLAKTVQG